MIQIFNPEGTNKAKALRPKLYKFNSENRIKIGTKIKKHHKVQINTTKNMIEDENNNENNQDIKTKRGITVVPLDQFGQIIRIL